MISLSLLLVAIVVMLIIISIAILLGKQGGAGFFVLMAVLFVLLGGGAATFLALNRTSSTSPIQPPVQEREYPGLPLLPSAQQLAQLAAYPTTGVKGRILFPNISCQLIGAMIKSPSKDEEQASWAIKVEENGDFELLGLCPGEKLIVACVADTDLNYYFYTIKANARLNEMTDLGQYEQPTGEASRLIANFVTDEGELLLPRTVFPGLQSVDARLLLTYRASEESMDESFKLEISIAVGEEVKLIGLGKGDLVVRPLGRFPTDRNRHYNAFSGMGLVREEVSSSLPIVKAPLQVKLLALVCDNYLVKLDFPADPFLSRVNFISRGRARRRNFNPAHRDSCSTSFSFWLPLREYQVFIYAAEYDRPNPALNYYSLGKYRTEGGDSEAYKATFKLGTMLSGVVKDSQGQLKANHKLHFRYEKFKCISGLNVETDSSGRFFIQALIPGEVIFCGDSLQAIRLAKAGETLEVTIN